ncbi:biopolymer transporter ExbD [Paraburkholderia sp. UCT31]|uniref:ExbD/TolR family protein n=1 Tax=Paraburkholderia sp. UCT31 TaxID=2615209 RepID=UPI00165621EB|nr:biopolymer transporter ExbD [Paraburkholderia sp. UCT31]MBC8737315.1 biopolymer transporter ExbD [Paraburkholderia sp. UCT31]
MFERKPLSAINITPLVDVLLILLVVLMLAIPVVAKRLPVDLPKTTLDAPPSARNTVRLMLQKDGAVLLGDQKTSLENALSAISSSSSVEIYPDAAVPYAAIAKLVTAVQGKFPADIALVTQ